MNNSNCTTLDIVSGERVEKDDMRRTRDAGKMLYHKMAILQWGIVKQISTAQAIFYIKNHRGRVLQYQKMRHCRGRAPQRDNKKWDVKEDRGTLQSQNMRRCRWGESKKTFKMKVLERGGGALQCQKWNIKEGWHQSATSKNEMLQRRQGKMDQIIKFKHFSFLIHLTKNASIIWSRNHIVF